jgi:hypothetical protein
MAEERLPRFDSAVPTAGEDSSHPTPLLRKSRVADGVYALVHPVESTRARSTVDRVL